MNNADNFKVFQASAGAGKTFTLIKEYLKLCLKSESTIANFRSILAITFTNAAANDMKAKIVKTLREIIDSEEIDLKSMEAKLIDELGISDAELKHNAQSLMTQIMHDYSNFCVCTIDAFVQKLSRSFAHDLGLPNKYSVCIDTNDVAESITGQLGLRISDEDDFLIRLLVDFSNNQFDSERSTALEEKLSEFVSKLMEEKAYHKDEGNGIKSCSQYMQTFDFLNERIKSFENEIDRYVAEVRQLEKQYGLTVEDYWNKKSGVWSHINKLERHQYLNEGSPKEPLLRGNFLKAIEGRKCLGDKTRQKENDAMLAVLVPLKDYYDANFRQYLFYKAQSSLLYLYALRAQIRIEFDALAKDEEIVHISEFNKLLNTMMGDFSVPFVYERIGEYFRHVFVDEFQDTSVLQWQNLLPLVDNGLATGNMSMVVGDGKQSIYRFRSGEVEQIINLPEIHALPKDERETAFLQFEQNLKDNFGFKNLDTNYRSFAQVVTFNNHFFKSVYGDLSPKWQRVYVSEKPGTDEGVDIEQKIDKVDDEGLVQVELYDFELQPDYCFERVEAIIRELTETNGYCYSDIVVLIRRSRYGSEMANYLSDKGIPVISEDSIMLKSSDRVQLLVNTLRYLLYGDNEINVANVLYYWKLTRDPSFKGDISLLFDEVKAIAQGEKPIEPVMGIGDPGLLRGTLSKATCLYDLCANLMRVFGFDGIRDTFLNYFMEEVFKFQSGINEGIAAFLSYWERKKDKDLSVKSVSGNAVKIMTIHKSKGLEFPVVIYPEAITNLDEKLAKNKVAEEWVRPEDLDYDHIPNLEYVLFRLDGNASLMGEKPAQHVMEETESNRLDNLNLLYVAFTRAVQRLYIIAKQSKKDQANLFAQFLKEQEQNRVSEPASGDVRVYRFGSSAFRNPNEKPQKDEGADLIDSTSVDWFGKISVDPNPTLVWQSKSDRLLPREFGELVHQILAKIRTIDEIDSVLSPFVADGTIDQETADWICTKFNQMAQDPLIASAFNASAKVKTECEILYQGKVIRLDRYAEFPNAVYVIDYKTGKTGEEHYRQVRTYTRALKEMTDKPIKAFLVYLTEERIEVDSVSVG